MNKSIEENEEDLWDASFLQSQDLLESMAAEAIAEYEAGKTKELEDEIQTIGEENAK